MTETEILKEVYAGLNQNDIPRALKNFDPQIVRVEFEGLPMAGTYRGRAEVEAHFLKGRGTWAEGSCTPVRFVIAGDKVVVYVHVLVRLKDKQDWIVGQTADVFTFRNGKIIEMRTFVESQQALEWVGVTERGKPRNQGDD